MRANLTKTVVEGLREGIVWDKRVTGFGARRQRAEGGVHYVLKRKGKWHTIGRHGDFTVETARAEAQRLVGLIVSGKDPRPEASGTFGDVVALYLAKRKPNVRPRSFVEIEHHLLTHSKPLHRLALIEVTRRAIAETLAKIEQGSGPIARNRVRASLSAFLNWCIREGLCETNPAKGTGKADEGDSRSRVLTTKEIAKLWTTQVAGQATAFIDIVQLLLLTGQRRNEIGDLRVSEIDFENRCLRLGAERTKNRREHIVPLSEPALSILSRVLVDAPASDGGNDGRVFRGFSWSLEKAKLDRGLRIAPWRIHDLRRTVATGLGDLGIAAPHIVETLLNHVSGHHAGVAGIYQRAKYETECRAALEAWGKWIETNATGEV
jgi:integrase